MYTTTDFIYNQSELNKLKKYPSFSFKASKKQRAIYSFIPKINLLKESITSKQN
jgi:hypothetical protein